jgi:hypothetical protein
MDNALPTQRLRHRLLLPALAATALVAGLWAGCGAENEAPPLPSRLNAKEIPLREFPILVNLGPSRAARPTDVKANPNPGGVPSEDPHAADAAAERIARRLAEEAAMRAKEAPSAPKEPPKPKEPAREDGALVGKELADLGELDVRLLKAAEALDFARGLALVEEFVKGLKTRAVKVEAEKRAVDLRSMDYVFGRLVESIEPGTEVDISSTLTMRVKKADRIQLTGTVGTATLTRKWTAISHETLLELISFDGMKADDEYGAAILAYVFNLPEIAERRLLRCAKADPARTSLLGEIIANRRGATVNTILSPYRGLWVSPDERALIDKGYERFNNKWMSPDEIMKAKGFIYFEGRWVTPKEHASLTKRARQIADLARKLQPKGLIDKPGADHEGIEWNKRRKYAIKRGHYTVEANLSMEAVKDVAYVMEVLHYNFRKIFGVRKTPKFVVKIGRNKAEYDNHLGGGGLGKCGQNGEISTFYQPPNTTMVLMHEGTHQFIFKYAPSCTRWWHEAMATYFECSKFTVNPKTRTLDLKTGLVNKWRLGPIQRELRAGTYVPMRRYILGQISGIQMYHQGWSISYYLINAKNGRYAKRFMWFLENKVGKGGQGRKKGARESKQVLRFMKALGIYDIDEFERDWKEFTLGLSLTTAEDFNSGHK